MKHIFTAFLLFSITLVSHSQSLDLSFGTGGKVILPFKQTNASFYAIAEDSKGNIFLAGEASDPNYLYAIVAKFDSQGKVITSFGTNGFWRDSTAYSDSKSYNCKGITTDESDNLYITTLVFDKDGSEILRKLDNNGKKVNSFGSLGLGFVYLAYNSRAFLTRAKSGYIMGSSLKMASPDGKRTKEISSGYGDLKFSSDGYVFNLNNGISKNDTSKSWPNSQVNAFGNNGKVSLIGNTSRIQLNSKNSVFVTANTDYISLKDSSFIYKLNPNNGAFFNNFGKAGTQFITFLEGKNRLEAMGEINDKYVYLSGKVDGAGTGSFALCKLDTNGNYATGFGNNGRMLIPMGGSDASANALMVNSKNEIFAAGYTTIDGQKQLAIIKLKNSPLSFDNKLVEEAIINVFPNPARDIVHIKNAEAFSSLNVFDFQGNKILTKSFENETTIDFSNVSSGIFMIELFSDKSRKTIKVEIR